MRVPTPLQINLLCSEPVAENVQDMMREVLRIHYEEEEGSKSVKEVTKMTQTDGTIALTKKCSSPL